MKHPNTKCFDADQTWKWEGLHFRYCPFCGVKLAK